LKIYYLLYENRLNPDYVIGFLRPDKVRGDACPVFMGSVTIAGKSGCLEILA
jgi:predicted nucleic acid-binding Zn finger protein